MRRALAPLLALGSLALASRGVGRGFVNGDAAIYTAQAWSGELHDRTVHLGYLLLARALSGLDASLPLALDVATALSAVLAACLVGLLARRRGLPPLVASLLFGLLALPRASFAEVDLPWIALILGAAAVRRIGLASGLVLGAVLLSPTALLALPWLFAFRAFSVEEGRGRPAWVLEALGPFCAALFAVGIQSLWDAPSWWISDRGVLNAMGGVSPRPFGVWARALWLPALLAVGGFRQRGSFGLAWTLPLLLAPADVPTWLLAGAPLALGAAAAWARSGAPLRAALLVLLSVQGILSLRAQEQEIRRVARVTAITEAMAARLLPGEALLAPWGWGVRVGVAATRDPYGVPWAPLEGPPPARALRWCGAEIRRVALLPPGVRPDPNPDLDGEGFRDEHGVSWFDVDPGVWQRRLGCEDVALREASPPG